MVRDLESRERLELIAKALRHCGEDVNRESLCRQYRHETKQEPAEVDLEVVIRHAGRAAEVEAQEARHTADRRRLKRERDEDGVLEDEAPRPCGKRVPPTPDPGVHYDHADAPPPAAAAAAPDRGLPPCSRCGKPFLGHAGAAGACQGWRP